MFSRYGISEGARLPKQEVTMGKVQLTRKVRW